MKGLVRSHPYRRVHLRASMYEKRRSNDERMLLAQKIKASDSYEQTTVGKN